ncbi:MAG TPA: peptidylprolyl isomerase [Aliidongia sp.]|nr:peptidylprolyl isomerase [Aliidongia sp.]
MHRTPSLFAKSRPAFIALALALPLVAQAASTKQATPPAAAPAGQAATNDPVVAKVNSSSIHLSDVVAAQRNLPQQAQSLPLQQIYPRLLDEVVSTKLVVDAAKASNIANDAEYKERVAKLQEQIMAQVYIHHAVEKAVTDDAVHKLYDSSIKTQPPKQEVHAHHILVASEDEAKAIIAQLDKGGDFQKLANEKTTDKSGSGNGGDLGWFSKDMMVPDFANAAFALKKGEYTKTPVKTQFGWHVIMVDDQREAPPPSFEESKQGLQQQLAQQTIQKTLADLRAKAKVEEFNPDGTPLEAEPKPDAKPEAKPDAKPEAKPDAKPAGK